MSRIGRKPIEIPEGVEIDVRPGAVAVKGPKGELNQQVNTDMQVAIDDGTLTVARPTDRGEHRALHGLTRSLINNMVRGVTDGFEKRLKIEGIGYQARKDKNKVVLTVGYANAIELTPPDGVTCDVPDPTTVVVKGADKQKVGQFAAEVRAARKPEPYKGKGIRYENEVVRRKEGKTFASGG